MADSRLYRPEWRTRSHLRRIGQNGDRRHRNWLLRYAGLGLLLAGAIALVSAIRDQAFAKDGPGYLLYWLHDAVYLFLRGEFWTRLFPHSLIWAIPTAVVAALVAAEFLLGAGLRPLQRRVVLALMGSRFAWLLPKALGRTRVAVDKWNAELETPDCTGPAYGGFALRVAKEQHVAAWHRLREKVLEANARPAQEDLLALTRPLVLALRLDPGNPRLLLRALEAVLVAPSHPATQRFGKDLQERVKRLKGASSAVDSGFDAILNAIDEAIMREHGRREEAIQIVSERLSFLQMALGRGVSVAPDVIRIAVDSILVSVLTQAHGLGIGKTYFNLASAARLSNATQKLAGRIELAETLVDIEFWAACAVRSGMRRFPVGDLEKALPRLGAIPDRDELFTVRGPEQ